MMIDIFLINKPLCFSRWLKLQSKDIVANDVTMNGLQEIKLKLQEFAQNVKAHTGINQGKNDFTGITVGKRI